MGALLHRLVTRLRSDRSGAAIMEFALVTPILAMMLLGMIDISLWITARMSVERAARAGAEYSVLHGFNQSAIATAVTSATKTRSTYMSTITASPAATQWCGCPSETGVTTAACGSTCTGGADAGTYVTANAQSTYHFINSWPGVTSPATITSAATVRID